LPQLPRLARRTFPPPPPVRLSQRDAAGISATDGITVVDPIVNQYENCLRCHGGSTGKQVKPIFGYAPVRLVATGDPLNVIPQLPSPLPQAIRHARRQQLIAQPSLRANMLNLDGLTQGRSMGNQIFCTDCHNSDDNREFGGSDPMVRTAPSGLTS